MGFWLGMPMVGVAVGVVSGMLGIGGGVMVIPALVFLFGFSHQQAVGTSVAMLLPPIGVFAFLTYYRADQVDLPSAALLAAGFALGAWLGAVLVTQGMLSESLLRKFFALFMIYVAMNMLLHSEAKAWATVATIGVMGMAWLSLVLAKLQGKKWERMSAPQIYADRLARPVVHDYEI